jgi:hypothetical protein
MQQNSWFTSSMKNELKRGATDKLCKSDLLYKANFHISYLPPEQGWRHKNDPEFAAFNLAMRAPEDEDYDTWLEYATTFPGISPLDRLVVVILR